MKTEILTICTPEDRQIVQKAAKLLDDGALVAFPTETVYGIGCKADIESLGLLDEVKGRQPDKRYTLHIGSFEQLNKYIPSMGLRAKKLVQNAFPGPVTIVFDLDEVALETAEAKLSKNIFELLYKNGTIGVRFPDCPVTAAILAATESPVVAPSANPAGLSPATSTKQVLNYFDGKIEYIVETPNFELNFKQSSTVVKISKKDVQILREGAISNTKIKEWTTVRIVFVCTGNTCRSPMAAGFCRKYFADNLGCQVDDLKDLGYIIDSAGVAAYEGSPASSHAVEVCRAVNVELARHRSRQLTPDDIEQSDVIFTMSRNHRDSIVQSFDSASKKCFMLNETQDILDPIGASKDVYQDCFRQICDCILKKRKIIL